MKIAGRRFELAFDKGADVGAWSPRFRRYRRVYGERTISEYELQWGTMLVLLSVTK